MDKSPKELQHLIIVVVFITTIANLMVPLVDSFNKGFNKGFNKEIENLSQLNTVLDSA
jgi:ABC-type sulfate transport system permease subunit